VWRPFTPTAICQDKGVVVLAPLQRLALLELHLPVADLFGDGLAVDGPDVIAGWEAPFAFACQSVQIQEAAPGELRQKDFPFDLGLRVLSRDEPDAGVQVDMFPARLHQLADTTGCRQAQPHGELRFFQYRPLRDAAIGGDGVIGLHRVEDVP
jgi:hypothetical protein